MARAYICTFLDYLDIYGKCTDEAFGRLIRAALLFARDGTEPSFPEGSMEDIYWPGVLAQVRRDVRNYQKKVKAGAKGNEKRWGKQEEPPAPVDGKAELIEMQKFIDSMADTSMK